MKLAQRTQKDYENILVSRGEDYFYKYIVGSGFMDRVNYDYPEVLILDKSDAFFTLFRRTGHENYFKIGKILRKAAHRLYRNRISIDDSAKNARFLNLVK